jgi:hypothetical protein
MTTLFDLRTVVDRLDFWAAFADGVRAIGIREVSVLELSDYHAFLEFTLICDGVEEKLQMNSIVGLDDLAAAIETVQDSWIDLLQTALPVCPSHSHPMQVTVVEQNVRWICPISGSSEMSGV